MRYRVEQLFGSIKQKIGSSFNLLREDLSRKASIACAILWNFWVLATYLFLLFLSGILQYSYAKDCGRFLEQSQILLDNFVKDKVNCFSISWIRLAKVQMLLSLF
jgi:type II secretory pathway component PulL